VKAEAIVNSEAVAVETTAEAAAVEPDGIARKRVAARET
jgi:hypothetical protein